MKESAFKNPVIILFSPKERKVQKEKKYFLNICLDVQDQNLLCVLHRRIKRKKKESTEIIRKEKNTQSSSSPLHQTQGKRRQVSICSIRTYCNMTKYRSAAGKMTSRQIAQQMVQPISEETL